MRPVPCRARAALAVLCLSALTVPAACSGGESSDYDIVTTTTRAGGSSTTAPDDGGSSTTAPDDGGSSTTAPDGGGSSTTAPAPDDTPSTDPPKGGLTDEDFGLSVGDLVDEGASFCQDALVLNELDLPEPANSAQLQQMVMGLDVMSKRMRARAATPEEQAAAGVAEALSAEVSAAATQAGNDPAAFNTFKPSSTVADGFSKAMPPVVAKCSPAPAYDDGEVG